MESIEHPSPDSERSRLSTLNQKNSSEELFFKEPRKLSSNRQSYSLVMSHGSLHHAEIGQAVPVHVVGGRDARMRSEAETNVDDDMSLVSESQVQLGRLNTIKVSTSSIMTPEYTISTEVENVVPPRLKRRPVSELLALAPKESSHHKHRFSLNINDDLDKLMESANDLKRPEDTLVSEKQTEESTLNSGSLISSPNRHSGHSRLNSMLSSDSFQTAGEGLSSTSLPPDFNSTAPLPLPKRPNADNLERARQASRQYSSRSISLQEGKDNPDADELVQTVDYSQASSGGFKEPEVKEVEMRAAGDARDYAENIQGFTVKDQSLGENDAANSVRSVDEVPLQESDIPVRSNKSVKSVKSVKSIKSVKSFKSVKSVELVQSANSVEPATSVKSSTDQPAVGESSDDSKGESKGASIEESAETPALQTPKKEIPAAPVTPQAHNSVRGSLSSSLTSEGMEPSQPVALRQSQSQQFEQKDLPPPPTKTLLSRSEISPGQPRDSVYTEYNADDGFYDIEEPVIVSKPARSKSVKESIQNPKRKTSKRRSGRKKAKDAFNLQLKPFSYNTLIHLLESMNGTVIGEEFETLNLPIEEKQMIEKIVDSLSRLTLDMVIDEKRYDVGMERLEKAHRVLEGFL